MYRMKTFLKTTSEPWEKCDAGRALLTTKLRTNEAGLCPSTTVMSTEQMSQEDMTADRGESIQPSQEPDSHDSPTQTASSFDALLVQVQEHPDNPDRWRDLVEMAELSFEPEKIRTTFDTLLRQYPNTVSPV